MPTPRKFFTEEEVKANHRRLKREYRERNREKLREKGREYMRRTKAQRAAAVLAWKRKNKVKRSAEYARHREANREYHLARLVEWRKHNKDKTVEYQNRRRARLMGGGGLGITPEQWEELKKEYGGRCAYCARSAKLTRDHITAIAKGGPDTLENCAPACFSCNMSKHDHEIVVWLARTGKRFLRKQLEAA